MSFIDSPIADNPGPDGRSLSDLLAALREVDDGYEFERLWGQALEAAASAEERAQVLVAAASRLDEVAARGGGSSGSDRLWLRQLATEVAARGGRDLPGSLASVAGKVVRKAVHEAEPDLQAWREAAGSNVPVSEFIRQSPRAVASLRDLGRLLERLRGTGVLSLVDAAVIDEIVEFHRLVSRGATRPFASVGEWMRVSRDDILQWSAGPSAHYQLPLLLRRLIRETGSGVISTHFPAGSAVTTGGWDGTAEATDESPYVPAGRSGWELSVEQGSQQKAESDFDARIDSVPSADRQEMTFVQVISRQWIKARTFEADARRRNEFRDVRAYNVDDLEEWLEQAPATTVWFRELLGHPLEGISTIGEVWQRWLGSTQPSLDSTIVLAGRDNAVANVRARAKAGPGITTVGGDVRLEEILAFFGAVSETSEEGDELQELVLVSSNQTARRVFQTPGPMILLATAAELVNDLPPASLHRVFVAVAGGTRVDVVLPPVDPRIIVDRLREHGTDFYVASEQGALARRSLLALRRRLAVQPELHRPDWAMAPIPALLRRILLLGSWNRGIAADRDAVERMVGDRYERVEESLRSYASAGDPFVALVDDYWHVVSTTDAWLLLASEVTDGDLGAFSDLALEILTDVDPLLSLPAEQRLRASFDGVTPSYSHQLRTGVARTLALLASVDLPTQLARGRSPTTAARSTIRQALQAASDDESFRTWTAVARELPLLAEAAPTELIETLEEGVAAAPDLIRQMFTDQEDGPLGTRSSPHTEFLWALERLAWSPDYFDDSIDLLAELDALDPGGRWSNRPRASVKSILCPWHPQTSAGREQRMAAVRRLRERHALLAWDVMLSMLPNQHSSQILHRGPEYRDWKEGEPVVTHDEYREVVNEVSLALIEDAGDSVDRWVALIHEIDSVSWDLHGELRADLERLAEVPLPEAERQRIWEALRSFLSRHREYADAKWAMPEEALSPFDSVAAAFQPTGATQRHAWLFAEGWVELGDIRRRDDFAEYEAELGRRRRDAAGDIFSTGGLEAVLAFSEGAALPGQVGLGLAQFTDSTDFDSTLLGLLGAEPNARMSVAFAYFAERFRSHGWDYVDELLRNSPSALASARLLRSTWSPTQAASRADELGTSVATQFWREFTYFGLGHDFDGVIEVSRRLCEVGRFASAIDLLALYARQDADDPEYALAAADALEGLTSGYGDDEETSQLREHEFDTLLKVIARHRDVVGSDRAVRIEWFFLPALGVDPDAPNLHQALADDPALFVQMVSLVYRAANESDDDRREVTELDRRVSNNAFRLLHSWHRCPGVDEGGAMNGDRLKAWVEETRRRLSDADRLSVGDDEIGQALVASPADDEGWPCREVRDLIEDLRNDRIDAGFQRRIFNNRGATMRSLDAGGQQEWELAQKYRSQAAEMRPRWRRLARIFDGLADTYEADARREDAAAERRRRGLD